VADGTQLEDPGDGEAGFDQRVTEAYRGQMAAGGPAGQYDRTVDPVRRTVGTEPVECCVYFGDDFSEGSIGGESIAGQGRRPATGVRSGDQVGELFLGVALPVAAMDEDDAGRVGIALGKQVPGVSFALAVAQVEVIGVGGPK